MSIEGLKDMAQTAMKAFTFDRSKETYGDNSVLAKAKGRDRIKLISLLALAFLTALFAQTLSLSIMQGGVVNYIVAGLSGTGALIALKEAILQHYTRKKELEESRTLVDMAASRFTLVDLAKELLGKTQETWSSFCDQTGINR